MFGLAPDSAKEWSLGLLGETGLIDIFLQVGLKIVVTGHFVTLAAFFAEADPEPPPLTVDIFDLHTERGADARKAVDHQTNQRPVTQTCNRGGIDTVD